MKSIYRVCACAVEVWTPLPVHSPANRPKCHHRVNKCKPSHGRVSLSMMCCVFIVTYGVGSMAGDVTIGSVYLYDAGTIPARWRSCPGSYLGDCADLPEAFREMPSFFVVTPTYRKIERVLVCWFLSSKNVPDEVVALAVRVSGAFLLRWGNAHLFTKEELHLEDHL